MKTTCICEYPNVIERECEYCDKYYKGLEEYERNEKIRMLELYGEKRVIKVCRHCYGCEVSGGLRDYHQWMITESDECSICLENNRLIKEYEAKTIYKSNDKLGEKNDEI